jgi:acetyl esterase/lipase
MNRTTKILVLFLLSACCAVAWAQAYKQVNDIPYTLKTDAYSLERLKLDVYYPTDVTDCPVIIWFHGGGLEGGSKEIPSTLREKGNVVVGVNYRLLSHVTVKEILDDAAEAVAWVFKHITEYGGDTRKIVVTGHSAGGYISMMLCLDKHWLAAYGVDADSVMMYVPFSGQAITHFNLRKMQGIPPLQATIDEYAPLYWVRGDCPPMVLVCGDRELELYGRYDENQYLARMMKLAGHQQTYLYEIDGHGHSGMIEPGFHILETHLKQMLGQPVYP